MREGKGERATPNSPKSPCAEGSGWTFSCRTCLAWDSTGVFKLNMQMAAARTSLAPLVLVSVLLVQLRLFER